ncbi:proteasome assembly chaperone 1 [Heterostelium album PN500]|uniref:Proteasome assembly chaperone 1 n=1 Tax=Heterostelium pallidum (strain ATCC 26659 / Pp 5 / PN500) TaxID=670386 RepID=D3BU26_HETP5|nr:proteasome assembly chaperone 1 [Heterostelium album PN500]EFA75212.1 proteasome assembly chaperone 1 [Heterostelium album PN500]|eukprot:XP_020427346.1 proteasome assembly chaperone 1 [Heterostelium album PN500]
MSRLLVNTCKPETVIIIDSLVDTQFISSDHTHPQPPFIRTLRTSNYVVDSNSFVPLESPNLVQGITAAILSQCEVEGIQCISLQNLVESSSLCNSSVINLENQMKKVNSIFQKVPPQSNQSYLKMVQLINRRDDRGLYI